MGKGKEGGALSSVHPVDLLATVLKAVIARNALDPALVDDVIVGCVTQSGEQANAARMAVLSAGFPVHVPATMIDRKCGSGQQAVHFAAQGVAAGAHDIVIAGGVESMSRVPMGSNRMRMDDHGPGVHARFAPGLVSQGIAAELVAAKWQLSRAELDAYAARSQQLAAQTSEAGGFVDEIIGVDVRGRMVAVDESIRPSTTVESLAQLKPAFRNEELAQRFPNQIDHFEVNEAFASVPLAWNREFEVDPARLNPRGGAIALGHPLGCSGARLMTTMVNALEQTRGRYGLQTMCEAGGMANATIIERA
ncbi:thiolase family protein [Bradyrhizobium sp. WSM 1704]|nr:thiolase family protein [Bradyrhizobium semiaridum]